MRATSLYKNTVKNLKISREFDDQLYQLSRVFDYDIETKAQSSPQRLLEDSWPTLPAYKD